MTFFSVFDLKNPSKRGGGFQTRRKCVFAYQIGNTIGMSSTLYGGPFHEANFLTDYSRDQKIHSNEKKHTLKADSDLFSK